VENLMFAPLKITTGINLFKPNSKVEANLYSEPTNLGDIDVKDNGSIEKSLKIPANIPAGHHTIVVSGESSAGEKIELYQTILIKGPNPDDIDENLF